MGFFADGNGDFSITKMGFVPDGNGDLSVTEIGFVADTDSQRDGHCC